MKKLFFNFKFVFSLLLLFYFLSSVSYATTLPSNVVETIKKELPNASIRFDGLITLPNGTIYLPVLPSNPKRNAQGKVVSTVPASKKLSQLPDVVLFDSNFAMLKVLKTKNGKLTVSTDVPFVVKTGIFPQDMLVPPGLVIPDDMQVMMGDLKIATTNSRVNDIFKSSVNVKKGVVNKKVVPIPYLAGKTLLITTLDSKILSVVPTDSTVPKFTLTLENLPKFIQPVCHDDYILVAAAGKTYIDVADVKQEVLVKKIDLSFQPTEIILSSDKTKAFVAVGNDQSIFIIDLKNMTLLEKIKIKGYPKNISISDDDQTIVYQDKNTGDIYTLSLDNMYLNKYVFNASNVSKLIIKDKNIYILSRTLNELQVVDTEIKDLIYKQPVAEKPVDMLLINDKIYILSASNELDIFNLDDFSFSRAIKLSDKGFSKKLINLANTNILLITNVTDKKYFVYDINKNAVVQTVDTPVFVNDMQIINKSLK